MVAMKENLILGGLLACVALVVPMASLVQISSSRMTDLDLFIVLGRTAHEVEKIAIDHQGQIVAVPNARLGILVSGTPDMIPILYQTGAWLVLPANALSFLCAPNTLQDTRL